MHISGKTLFICITRVYNHIDGIRFLFPATGQIIWNMQERRPVDDRQIVKAARMINRRGLKDSFDGQRTGRGGNIIERFNLFI